MTLQFFTVYLVLENFCWDFPEMDVCCYYVWKSMAKIRDFIDCENSYITYSEHERFNRALGSLLLLLSRRLRILGVIIIKPLHRRHNDWLELEILLAINEGLGG